MAFEQGSVLIGGLIGLAGGLGGVLLGHVLSRRRETQSRSLEGLRLVIAELSRLRRLALFFEQQINLTLREGHTTEAAKNLVATSDWQKATHEMMEAHWRFPCMAYLPNAQDDFEELSRFLLCIMDPYSRAPGAEHEMTSDQAHEKFREAAMRIRNKVEARLKQVQ